jgi:proline iminopeptidase
MTRIPAPAAQGVTTTTPVPLWWGEWGPADAPPVVLLHGGPGAHHDYLLPQFLHLAQRFRVLAYDQRGGGQSRTDDTTPIGWPTHVADLASVIAERLHGQPPVLVGYSWGALLAMLYAIEATRRHVSPAPAALALVSPAAIAMAWRRESEAAFAAAAASPAVRALREALAKNPLKTADPAAYRQRAFEVAVAPWFHDPAKAAGLTPFRLVEKVQRSTWESLGDYDLRADLAQVKVPAVIVTGRNDPIPVASAQAAALALAAPCHVLDACGHVPYVEAQAPLFDVLDPFLASVAAPARTA